jgi:HAD superfamily hydrolase (TIGR01490 family)
MKSEELIYAFFDVDGTLINFNSIVNFLAYFFYTYFGEEEAKIKLSKYEEEIAKIGPNGSREKMNELYYKNFSGIKKSLLESISFDWFSKVIGDKNIFNTHALAALKHHQEVEHEVVFVSGGFFATLNPLAQYLNVKHILCVEPIANEGILTGEIDFDKQTLGKGKSIAIQQFINCSNSTNLKYCYAYGDHISDSYMLELVGNPCVVGDDEDMLELAKQSKWKILGK